MAIDNSFNPGNVVGERRRQKERERDGENGQGAGGESLYALFLAILGAAGLRLRPDASESAARSNLVRTLRRTTISLQVLGEERQRLSALSLKGIILRRSCS